MPAAWFTYVASRCNGNLPDDAQHQIALLLWSFNQRKNHSADNACKSIGYDELYRRFGKFRGVGELLESGLFEVSPGWSRPHTRKYSLTEYGQRVIDDYFELQAITPSRDRKTRPQATASSNYMISPQVKVNRDALTALAAATDNPHHRTAANQTAHCTDDNDCIDQYYTEHSGGRLFLHGPINLQNMASDVRDAALAGLHDYDLKNCYPTIFDHVAERLQINTPMLNYYLSHRDEFLNELAAQMKCNPKQCKAALLALMHFAGPAGIIEATGKRDQTPFTESQAKRFLTLPKVKRLRAEFKRVGNAWIAEAKDKAGKWMVNDHGKGCSRKLPARKLISHLLQGVEAVALEAIREVYSDQIRLLMHDGFVTEGKINRKYLEGKIRQATGIRFQLKRTAITSQFHVIKPTLDETPQTATGLPFNASINNQQSIKGLVVVRGGGVCGRGGVCVCGCCLTDRSVLFKPLQI